MPEFIETYHNLELKKDADLEVMLMGSEDCAPGHHYGPDLRPYHILHFVTGGKGTLHIENRTFELERGCVFYIPENTAAYYEASASDPWQYSWCAFLGSRANTFKYHYMALAEGKYVMRGINTEQYAAIIQKAVGLKGKSASNYLYANSVLYELFAAMSENYTANLHAVHVPELHERIKFQLDTRYTDNITISQVAETLGIHPNYLSQLFREHYHISPKKYLMNLKMSRASNLLKTTEMPIYAISSALGFEDQMSFSKAFKKQFGMSPMRYRKEYLAGLESSSQD